MTTLLDGKAVATVIRQEIAAAVGEYSQRGIRPRLDAVLVGDDPEAVHYVRAKERVAKSLGIEFRLHRLPGATNDGEFLERLQALNADSAVHGIILELPLPRHLDRERALESISPLKDVDGVHPLNRGRLMSGIEGLYPATPLSCLRILRAYGIEIAGKHAVIVGRGETVGKPLVFLLLGENATVTVCHTRTADLAGHTRQADLLVTAAGRAGLIGAGMVKPGAVVVDAGISAVDGSLRGDVDFETVRGVASAITPVPGGVGSVTTVLVMKNLLQAMKMQGVDGGGNR
ncbi:bifunctional 5,10-methylenetetrahydrofolate dehydrogenase/5,10-methenyltetrahydrofolate cyclohydrolase [Candidatus Desulforudis audaxviator]|uniref:Bifunctional protein FolD n=1 Tax=Desulforudis audaxviator (strain MP104C) TaxID=477974 RepID=B1I3J1_DESAP|nr:bifunctional 5,10-methylenetetrahydrofolate dehydrogenase/5,10-methenyltetrahydrofolate cyclohydrolase [Candidatus Desulforudis audaxviator]ACA59534.1 Methenyltetrahydrofolate cyclohydrolase [Candidatus Desulforudis audaxviator MP104C]AZK59517.1 Methylenetetrahydrofolate dehydrogenase / Methenyltetrahydrofolate cyclohydrolase [Candidatus Desulforudis audaxviator]